MILMVFPRCEAHTDVTCLQVIAKKEVIPKNRGGGCPPAPSPKSATETLGNGKKNFRLIVQCLVGAFLKDFTLSLLTPKENIIIF